MHAAPAFFNWLHCNDIPIYTDRETAYNTPYNQYTHFLVRCGNLFAHVPINRFVSLTKYDIKHDIYICMKKRAGFSVVNGHAHYHAINKAVERSYVCSPASIDGTTIVVPEITTDAPQAMTLIVQDGLNELAIRISWGIADKWVEFYTEKIFASFEKA